MFPSFFSNDGNHLSYQHFSTLIRFSNTAIPAYFVVAPFAFDLLLRKRRYVLPVIAVMLLTLAAVPACHAFASSNLTQRQNPFSLNYRSAGVVIRDYVTGNPGGAPFLIMGLSRDGGTLQTSWFWTPGTSATNDVSFFPYLTYQQLASHKWPMFYVFGDDNNQMYCELNAVIPLGVALGQYQVVGEKQVLNQSGYRLVKVDLNWLTN